MHATYVYIYKYVSPVGSGISASRKFGRENETEGNQGKNKNERTMMLVRDNSKTCK